jgi:hypothetical protein
MSQQVPDMSARQHEDHWNRHLSPDLRKEPWALVNDDLIFCKSAELEGKGVNISDYLTNGTEAIVRNRVNALRKQRRQ